MPARRADVSSMLEMLPPFALRVAATLRLSDHIAAGHTGIAELAAAAGADRDALARLLRYLVTLGVYAEPEPDRYAVTPAGRLLAAASPGGLRDWLDLDGPGGRMDLALTGLLHTVRTGTPGFPRVFGHGFWADLAEQPARGDTFDALMAGKSARVAAELASEMDWSSANHVLDVGGGNGAVLRTILSTWPNLHGTVLELPGPAARAAETLADLGNRASVLTGSFLDDVPLAGDTVLLFDILHDWDDVHALAILRHCADACPPQGRVLVVEEIPVGPADRNGAAMDLKMLVLFGGRQRDATELSRLATLAGLTPAGVQRLPSGFAVLTATRGAAVPAAAMAGEESAR